MTTARSEQIDLTSTLYYHVMTRCVRRSFLCGTDYQTGRNYSHRKQWLVDRFKFLADVFAIKICAYAVMSNHYHLVLFVNEDEALSWTDEEVRTRWGILFAQDAKNLDSLLYSGASKKVIQDKIDLWRERLTNISWFMRCLNEKIARLSNKEDELTGRFWEGRFKSQALLDEGAVLSAMAYVDLNPIRAGIAETPETSEFTSIYERILYVVKKQKKSSKRTHTNKYKDEKIATLYDNAKQPLQLMSFGNTSKNKTKLPIIDFKLSDYLQLIDATGRVLRDDKRGSIPQSLSPILNRLNLTSAGWVGMVKGLGRQFSYAIGNAYHLTDFIKDSKRALKGTTLAKSCYLEVAA